MTRHVNPRPLRPRSQRPRLRQYLTRPVSNWERILTGGGLNCLPQALTVLPEQWKPHHGYSPERQLLLTLLGDAFVALRKGDPELVQEVEDWVCGAEAPIPFRTLCEFLDLEFVYARHRFLRLIGLLRQGALTDTLARPRGLHHHHATGRTPTATSDEEVL